MAIAGGFATDERVAEIEEELGLDQPLLTRYTNYLGDLSNGDLGESFYTRRSVREEILERLPNSIELIVPALALAALLGLALGSVSAYFRQRMPERVMRLVITATQSVPDFLLALLLIYVVFFVLGWAPSPVGRLGIVENPPEPITNFLIVDSVLRGQWAILGSLMYHLMLPVLALGVVYSAYFAKTSRTALTSSLGSQQVEFARACGLPERQVFWYAFLAVRTPLLTYGAILLGSLLGGAAIVETIFSWRGLGQWALDAMLKLDLPAIQGFVLVVGLLTLLIYLLLDLVVLILDPRVSYRD